MHQAVDFVARWFEQLRADQIVLVPIRPKALNDQEAFDGDYDFLAAGNRMEQLLSRLFMMASGECMHFTVNRSKLGKTRLYIYDPQDSRPITIEIWNQLEVRDRQTLRYIFFEDIEPYIEKTPAGTYAFDHEVEALYYLSHLQTKGKDLSAAEVRSRLEYYQDLLGDAESTVRDLFGRLINEPGLRDPVAAEANRLLVEKRILFNARDRDKSLRARRLQRTGRWYRLYGRWLRLLKITPVLGPDGVGKTSIIEALQQQSRSRVYYYRFKKLFRHNLLYQVSRRVLARKMPPELAKNQYDDIYGSWLLTIAWLRYPLLMLKSLLSGRYYFCDRYFHDLIFENARFQDRTTRLRDNWEQLLKKSPRSFWFIQLDAPTDVVHARKQELSAQAIDSYRESVFRLYLKKPSRVYSYINTALPLEQCSAALSHSGLALGVKAR